MSMKAVIPAAGLGTRFLPYTRTQPKEMLPIVDKPALHYVVEEATRSGLRDILIITGPGKRAIEDYFDRSVEPIRELQVAASEANGSSLEELLERTNIYYKRQQARRGLGHAVLIAEDYVGSEAFSVLLGDDLTFHEVPCQKALIEVHKAVHASVVAVQEVPPERIGRYGMVEGEEVGAGLVRIERIVEKPRPHEITSNLATIGRYVLSPAVFDCLRETRPDDRGEIQLTDAIGALLKKEEIYAHMFPGRRHDIGYKFGWLAANLELALERPDLSEDLLALLESLMQNPRRRGPAQKTTLKVRP